MAFEQDTGDDKAAPLLANLIGVGGLAPFFICAGAAHSGVSPWAEFALSVCVIYGALILSFVGAVHFGLAINGDRSPIWFVWSVIPALIAWGPACLLDSRTALIVLVPGFLLAWSVDRYAARVGLIPGWYMRLRDMLTLGAGLALSAGSLAPGPHPHF